jgi:hypothetical protein
MSSTTSPDVEMVDAFPPIVDDELLQPPSQTKNHRYKPPTADSNTFATQQAFLESLQPVPIEEVDEDKRKCPICWKCFGEAPDPGFDNSELPVKLRCNHVFGQKCLANIFGMPDTSHLELRPLSFTPGSKGCILGEKLDNYLKKHGSNVVDESEHFENMLRESDDTVKGVEKYGHHWQALIYEIEHADRDMTDITLLENAVVLDYEPSKPKKHTHTSYEILPEHLTASSNGLDQTLTNVAHAPGFVNQGSTTSSQPLSMSELPAAIPTPSSSVQYSLNFMSQLPSVEPTHMASLALSENPTSELSPTMPALSSSMEPIPGFGSQPPALTSLPPSNAAAVIQLEQYMTGAFTNLQPDSIAYKSWQAALATETNLDKLSALHKQKSSTEKAPEDLDAKKLEALKAQAAIDEARAQEILRMKGVYLHFPCTLQQTDQRLADKERKEETVRKLLAQKLVDVFRQYKAVHLDSPRHVTPGDPPELFHTAVRVHQGDSGKTSYAIPSPLGGGFYGDDDSDDEDANDLSGWTMIIIRSICGACGTSARGETLATPTELTWQNHKSTPDNCPLCHRVLFKKSSGY